MTGKIFFRTDFEEQPLQLDSSTYKESFMKETIDYAIRRFNTISEQGMHGAVSGSDETSSNNVIAFVGDRGTGKTSCMLSVVKILEERQRDSVRTNHFIKMIDPSFFDEDHSILAILIGKLYAEFRAYAEKLNGDKSQLIRNLVESFKKVKDCLKFLEKSIDHDNDSLEELNSLAAGVSLRKAFGQLVTDFNRLFDTNRLVIPIDDIDLNTVQAFKMMELIRKYIMQDNTILLFAVKVPQLTNAVKLELTKQYSYILGEDKHMTASDIAMMADRYVEKLLPINSRVYMPDVDAILSQPLVISDGKTDKEYPIAGEAVPWLVFAKTRYLFYNTEGGYSRIIPQRLRELRQMVMMLYNMPDYNSDVSMYDDSDTGRQNRYNKSTFKNYFFNAISDSLPASLRHIAEAIYMHRDNASLNKTVIDLLQKHVKESFENKSTREDIETDDQSELALIVSPDNQSYNVSVGDVMLYLNNLEKLSADASIQTLIFFIKSWYSIRLYELYDLRDDAKNSGTPAESYAKPLLKNQLLKGIDELGRLIGGSYITLTDNMFLPPQGTTAKNPRERKKINCDIIRAKIDEITKTWDEINGNDVISAYRDDPSSVADDIKARLGHMVSELRTVEFFILCTRRYIPSHNEPYRQLSDVYYTRNLQSVTNLLLDVTTPLYSLQDVESTYGRFNDRIYKICSSLNVRPYMSLWSEMLTSSNRSFLSRATIRNVEILEDMCDFVRRYRDTRNRDREGRLLSDIYSTFFQTLNEYAALTYPQTFEPDDATAFHEIKLDYFDVLHKFLHYPPLAGYQGYCLDVDLFSQIVGSEETGTSETIKRRSSYLRGHIVSLIENSYPDLVADSDFTRKVNNFFQKDNKKYSSKTVIEKLARLSRAIGSRLDNIFDADSLTEYKAELQSLENNSGE